ATVTILTYSRAVVALLAGNWRRTKNEGGTNERTAAWSCQASRQRCPGAGRIDCLRTDCDLLQLPAGVGRLGDPTAADQGQDRGHGARRQQEFGSGARAAGRREGEPGGRRRLLRRDLRHPGEEGWRDRGVQAGTLGRYSRWPQGPGRILVHDPLRDARLH